MRWIRIPCLRARVACRRLEPLAPRRTPLSMRTVPSPYISRYLPSQRQRRLADACRPWASRRGRRRGADPPSASRVSFDARIDLLRIVSSEAQSESSVGRDERVRAVADPARSRCRRSRLDHDVGVAHVPRSRPRPGCDSPVNRPAMRGAENVPVMTPSNVPRPPTSIAPVGPATAVMIRGEQRDRSPASHGS